MKTTAQITISIGSETLAAIDRAAAEARLPRSRVIDMVLNGWATQHGFTDPTPSDAPASEQAA